MSNELTVGVDLRWSYLIQFPLTQAPEKQEIRFVVFTNKSAIERKLDKKPNKSFLLVGSSEEKLAYSIEFTDVTWGEDLSSQIASYILSKTESVPRWKIYLRGLRSSLAFPLAALASVLVFMWSILSIDRELSENIRKYMPIDKAIEKFQNVDQKLDFIVAMTADRLINPPSLTIIFWMFAKTIVITLAVVLFYFVLTTRKASFINLNDYSERYLKQHGRNYEFIKYSLIIGSIISIATGIFSNRLYDAIKTWL